LTTNPTRAGQHAPDKHAPDDDIEDQDDDDPDRQADEIEQGKGRIPQAQQGIFEPGLKRGHGQAKDCERERNGQHGKRQSWEDEGVERPAG
jgi:hypothetical protein